MLGLILTSLAVNGVVSDLKELFFHLELGGDTENSVLRHGELKKAWLELDDTVAPS